MLVDVETLALGRRVLQRIEAGETDVGAFSTADLDAVDAGLALALEEERLRSCAEGG